MMFQMCGVFAEFERAMIVERVNAGLARARAKGKTLGRPKVGPEVEDRIRKLAAQGVGRVKIARTLGVGVGVRVAARTVAPRRIPWRAREVGTRRSRSRGPHGGTSGRSAHPMGPRILAVFSSGGVRMINDPAVRTESRGTSRLFASSETSGTSSA